MGIKSRRYLVTLFYALNQYLHQIFLLCCHLHCRLHWTRSAPHFYHSRFQLRQKVDIVLAVLIISFSPLSGSSSSSHCSELIFQKPSNGKVSSLYKTLSPVNKCHVRYCQQETFLQHSSCGFSRALRESSQKCLKGRRLQTSRVLPPWIGARWATYSSSKL